MVRLSFGLSIALSSILLASSAAADPAAAPPAVAPPPSGYAPPPYYYGPPYPYPSPPPPEVRRRYSTPMMITGIVLGAVGSIALGIGTAFYVISDSIVCDSSGSCGPSHGGDTVVMVAGGIASLAGIPLIAVGAHSVPVKPGETALVPAISVSPRGASLTFSF